MSSYFLVFKAMNLQEYTQSRKELFWDVKSLENLSELQIQERFMQYGNWKDIQFLQEILGENFTRNYKILRAKKRVNLGKKTLHFFDKYLHV